MDNIIPDVASVLGMLSTLYITLVLLRRIFLQRTLLLAQEADAVVTAYLYERYDDILTQFGSPLPRPAASARADADSPLQAARAASWRPLLPQDEASTADVVVDMPSSLPPTPASRLRRWSQQIGGLPAPACEAAPRIGNASFDDARLSADWMRILRHSLVRFADVAGRPLLDDGTRDAVLAAAVAAMRARAPFCSAAEGDHHVRTAYCRASSALSARLCADYFRFCAVAAHIR